MSITKTCLTLLELINNDKPFQTLWIDRDKKENKVRKSIKQGLLSACWAFKIYTGDINTNKVHLDP